MSNFATLFQLLKRDLLAFWRTFPPKAFDMTIFFITNVVVWAYLMPQEWVGKSYGFFFVVGAIGSFGLIEVIGKVGIVMADLEGPKTLNQLLVLPIRSEVIFCYMAIFWGISSIFLSIFLFPLGKLFLFHDFPLSQFSYGKLVVIYLSGNLFYGFFSLWLVARLKGMNSINTIWMRIISPMWLLGAYFFSWQAAYKLSPIFGYVMLVNPMVYVMEGIRSATLGPVGYLPFWISLLGTWLFIFACAIDAIKCLKKRLDCV